MIVMATACNRCKRIVGPFANNKHAARVAAHLEGWTVYGRSGGQQDICPDCSKPKERATTHTPFPLVIDESGLEFAGETAPQDVAVCPHCNKTGEVSVEHRDQDGNYLGTEIHQCECGGAPEDEKEKQGAQTADPAP